MTFDIYAHTFWLFPLFPGIILQNMTRQIKPY